MKDFACKLLIIVMLFCLIALCIFYGSRDMASLQSISEHMEGELLTFSQTTGFYKETVAVQLRRNPELMGMGEVYYTIDGTDPREDGLLYSGEISLQYQPDQLQVVELKAVVRYKEEYSEIFSQTYIIGDSIFSYYGLPIVHISTDPANLYDPDTGIFVYGTKYEQAVADGKEGWDANFYANFYQEGEAWEKPSVLTVFDTDGTVLARQNVKLAITGDSSRMYAVKSPKILAEETAEEENGKLILRLYQNEASALSMVSRYNTLRLRSGGQDRFTGNIRSAVTSRLAELSNFEGIPSTNRCVVCVNGQYYGLFDIQQNYSPSFLRNRFGLPDTEHIARFKGSETPAMEAAGIQELVWADLTQEENRVALERAVDMDSLLKYYAINLLLNNTDWPQANFEMWRYTGGFDGNNPYTDGRIRFLMYDSDLIWCNAYDAFLYFEGDNQSALECMMTSQYRLANSCFPNLMKAEKYRNRFLTLICDLRNTSFCEEQILQIIQEETDRRQTYNKTVLSAESMESFNDRIEMLRRGVKKTNQEWPDLLERYFGVGEKYAVTIENKGATVLSWSNQKLFQGEAYTAPYYKGIGFTISQTENPGHQFEYWLVNGKPVYTEDLIITDEMAWEDLLIQTVTSPCSGPCLMIQEVSARGDSDWIKLKNYGTQPVNLEGYYISDNANKMLQYELPQVVLAPGASITVNGANNYYAIGAYICNFNLSEGESLFLSYQGQVVDRLAIPRMDSGETYGRYCESGVYYYFNNQENCRYGQ